MWRVARGGTLARMAITLYGETYWFSPYVFTAFVALKEKGVDFDVKIVDLAKGEQKTQAFAPTLTGRVPALEHDGFWLAESSAIAEYVDEAFPGPRLFPAATRDRARARQIMAWIRSDLMPLREERPTSTFFYQKATASLSERARAAADKLLAVCDRLIVEGRTQLFDTWSIADADLAFMLHRLLLNGEDVPAKVRAFAEAQWKRPSARAYLDHARPAVGP